MDRSGKKQTTENTITLFVPLPILLLKTYSGTLVETPDLNEKNNRAAFS